MSPRALALALAPCVALAQPAPQPAPAAQPAPQPAPVAQPAPPATPPAAPQRPARPADKQTPRVIELDDIVVRGEVQKPEVFYILQRSELNFKGQEPDKTFIPSIIESVDKDPF